MKKSDLFNTHFPCPTDRMVYPIYQKFLNLQKEILKNWQQDVVAQRIGVRDFVDFASCRIHVANGRHADSASAVISLKPFIGLDVQEQLDFFSTFFALYSYHISAVVTLMRKRLAGEIMESLWTQADKVRTHVHITTVLAMIAAEKAGTLTIDHLVTFAEERDPNVVNEMVRGLDVYDVLGSKFADGGWWYDHPNQDIVSAFWRYAKTMNDVDPKRVEALNQVRQALPKSHIVLPVQVAKVLAETTKRVAPAMFEGDAAATAEALNAAGRATTAIAQVGG